MKTSIYGKVALGSITAVNFVMQQSHFDSCILGQSQATQAHDLSAVLFFIFIDFVREINFGSKSYKIWA